VGVLGHQLRVERAVAVPRDVEIDRADLGQDRLGGGPVAVVARAMPGRVARLVAQMIAQLLSQAPLQEPLGQLGEHPVRSEQLEPASIDLGHHRVQHLVSHHLPRIGHRHRRSGRISRHRHLKFLL